MQTRPILGVQVVSTSMEEVLASIEHVARGTRQNTSKYGPFWIVTANPEIVLLAQENAKYAELINSADVVIADGVGLKWAWPNVQVVRGREVVAELVKQNYKIFYLGGQGGVAGKMAEKYLGWSDEGYQDIKNQISNSKITNQILEKINRYQPDVLLVAYGAPWQEMWIGQNLDKLKVKVVMGVGGTFDYLVGKSKLPPEWITSLGLEWLWRVVQQPWRWKRIWRAVVVFPWRVLISK